jgi:Flp pilus assembly protein TadG
MVTRKLRRWRDRGAAAVEFALVLPLLAMILLGTMEFGYAFFIQSTVAGAARVGVRNYAINWSQASTETNAQITAKALAQSVVPTPADVTSQTLTKCTVAGGQTTLVITYRYHSLTRLFDGLLGSNIEITGVGSMACGG